MKKKITGYIKLQLPAGKANPSPPVGPALGQHGVNIMAFCKDFNARTRVAGRHDHPGGDHGLLRPLVHLHHEDAAGARAPQEGRRARHDEEAGRGSKEPNKNKVGKVTHEAARASSPQLKMQDMNTTNLEAAMRSMAGTARSMGIEIVD